MKVNTKIIKRLRPCEDRFNNYLQYHKHFDGDLQDFIVLKNITFSDKIWVISKLFTKDQRIKWGLMCAMSVLHVFEDKYPLDKRPRLALEAVEKYLNYPSKENQHSAKVASNAAACAAAAAYAVAAAAYAVGAAADAAYGVAAAAANAANAANDAHAACAVAHTANAAYAAYAASAASAMENASKADKEEVILLYALMSLNQ